MLIKYKNSESRDLEKVEKSGLSEVVLAYELLSDLTNHNAD